MRTLFAGILFLPALMYGAITSVGGIQITIDDYVQGSNTGSIVLPEDQRISDFLLSGGEMCLDGLCSDQLTGLNDPFLLRLTRFSLKCEFNDSCGTSTVALDAQDVSGSIDPYMRVHLSGSSVRLSGASAQGSFYWLVNIQGGDSLEGNEDVSFAGGSFSIDKLVDLRSLDCSLCTFDFHVAMFLPITGAGQTITFPDSVEVSFSQASAVPDPATFGLFGVALLLAVGLRERIRR